MIKITLVKIADVEDDVVVDSDDVVVDSDDVVVDSDDVVVDSDNVELVVDSESVVGSEVVEASVVEDAVEGRVVDLDDVFDSGVVLLFVIEIVVLSVTGFAVVVVLTTKDYQFLKWLF